MAATGKSPNPRHAATIPNISAANPVTGDTVVSKMAGKVITESVTYGT